ncbi:MAG: class I SAM-dependent methyltransferase [Gammaproteobacteria bacterium]|nr:class I SAM-dependent methyltransferase [Gammaproteobacteria bacterium]
MRKTLNEIGRQFDTDKPASGYTDRYARYFERYRDAPVKLLELGVRTGGSLLMWREYFAQGVIVGIDINQSPFTGDMPERVHFYPGSQDDRQLLTQIARETAPDGFDIIIDDAAHVGILARASFDCLFADHLKPGGIYVIEDWGTGYWNTWADGELYHGSASSDRATESRVSLIARTLLRRLSRRLGLAGPPAESNAVDPHFASHNFGMVGFVKELVDRLAWGDITRPGSGNEKIAMTDLGIKNITFFPGQVFIEKR